MSFIGMAINLWKRAETPSGPVTKSYILQEDGVGKFTLEDDSGFIIMEH